jgi:enoyl-CoA hydratase/carnithine racemase
MAVLETQVDGHVFIMTLNRPEAMNAFSSELIAAVGDAWKRFREDGNLRCAIMTGAGERAFSAGADLKEMAQRNAGGGPQRNTFWDMPEPQLYRGMELWKPVIAAINGFALGGGLETAMACDVRVASEKASFGLPEVARGIIPGAGGTQRLPRLVPFGIALELLMTGRRIDAQEAYRIGLVNHVVAHEKLMDKSLEIAHEIGKNAPLAVSAAKESAYRGLNTTLQEGLRIENFESQAIRYTDDAKEGPKAFAEKREANYQGR